MKQAECFEQEKRNNFSKRKRSGGSGSSSGSSADKEQSATTAETKIIKRMSQLKKLSDELRTANCPLFGGRNCERLSADLRKKAAKLDYELDRLLSFDDCMSDLPSDHLRLYVAQGETWQVFMDKVKQYDCSEKCNVVWPTDAIAYRCKTCALSPCMSLCAQCFSDGNHEGHDFNRFFSQAGGACDCGSVDAILPSGFCYRHKQCRDCSPVPPSNMNSLTEFIIPKLFVRMFLSFRGWHNDYTLIWIRTLMLETKESFSNSMVGKQSGVIEVLQDLIESGALLTDAVADILLDTELYSALNSRKSADDLEERGARVDFSLDWRSQNYLAEDFASLHLTYEQFSFDCLLDELLFWTVRLYFPQKIINFSLSLLSHSRYRNHYGRKFFCIYRALPILINELCDSDTDVSLDNISFRIIHISVQILSGSTSCLAIDEAINVKYILIECVWNVLKHVTCLSPFNHDRRYFEISSLPSTLPAAIFRSHIYSLEQNQSIIRRAYATIVTDMQTLFIHSKIVERFFADSESLELYSTTVAHCQGFNVNYRIVSGEHVEYDSAQLYRFTFSLEHELSAAIMSHCVKAISTTSDRRGVRNYISMWRDKLMAWLNAINMPDNEFQTPPFQLTYHLPLHRQFSAAVYRCVEIPDLNNLADEFGADEEFLRKILLHPMRIQVGLAEAVAGMWARNGDCTRNQSFLYSHAHYCAAFSDIDLTLIKFVASKIHPEIFMQILIHSYHLYECLQLENISEAKIVTRLKWVSPLIDGALRLIVETIVLQWNSDSSNKFSLRNEITAALAISDKTYSKLCRVLPEYCNRSGLTSGIFDEVLNEVACYVEPDLGNHISEGVYQLKFVSWRECFNPVFCRMRASARDYNGALLRLEEAERKNTCQSLVLRTYDHLWVPYQLFGGTCLGTQQLLPSVNDLLVTPSFFSLMHLILEMILSCDRMNDTPLQQVIYLLTLCVQHVTSNNFVLRKYNYHPTCQNFNVPCVYSGFHEKNDAEHGMDDRTYILTAFSWSARPKRSLIDTLLTHLERAIGVKGEDRNAALIQVLGKLLVKERELVRISGNATDYMGRLLCLLYHSCEQLKEYINAALPGLQVAAESNSSHIDLYMVSTLEERRLKAKRRQEALLAAQRRKNAELMKKMMQFEGLNESEMEAMDTKTSSDELYTCSICSDCSELNWERHFGLLFNLSFNYAVKQSLPASEPVYTLVEKFNRRGSEINSVLNLKSLQELKNELILSNEHLISSVESVSCGIQIRTCGHFAHLDCLSSYFTSCIDMPEVMPRSSTCPLCRAAIIGIIPVLPEDDGVFLRNLPCESNDLESNVEFMSSVTEMCLKDRLNYVMEILKRSRLMEKRINSSCLKPLRCVYNRITADVTRVFMQLRNYPEQSDDSHGIDSPSLCLMLARSNCELDVLLSELNNSTKRFKRSPVELVLSALQEMPHSYNMNTIKIWEWLTGFTAAHDFQTAPFDSCLPSQRNTRVDEVSAGVTKSISDEHDRFSFILLDMKYILVRLSAYVMRDVWCSVVAKRDLLVAVYQILLTLTIVRTAMFVAVRLPLHQGKAFLKMEASFPLSSDFCDQEQIVISTIKQMFANKLEVMFDLLIQNTALVNVMDEVKSSCTDFSRFAAQLWHDCRIKVLPAEMQLGCMELSDIYFFLTGRKQLSMESILMDSVPHLIKNTLIDLMQPKFARIAANEPFRLRRPILLELPDSYETLFNIFYGKPCEMCSSAPKNPMVCMLCARLVCLDHYCSSVTPGRARYERSEVVRHAYDCGSGHCCFVSINTSLIIIVNHERRAIWGSLYLDHHGEEDRNLRRGKPLFLSLRRYQLLCEEWLFQNYNQRNSVTFFYHDEPEFLRQLYAYLRS